MAHTWQGRQGPATQGVCEESKEAAHQPWACCFPVQLLPWISASKMWFPVSHEPWSQGECCCPDGKAELTRTANPRELSDPLIIKGLLGHIGEGNGTPLQYSCLENPMNRGAWWAAVHGVAKSRTQLSYLTFTFHFHALEKEMATHSSVLAWRIPGMGEPGGCRLWGRRESDTTEVA